MTKMTTSTGLRAALTLLCLASLQACGTTAINKVNHDQLDRSNKAVELVNNTEDSLMSQIDKNVRGGTANVDALAAEQAAGLVARRATKPFIGSVMVPVTSEDKLPAIFREPFTLDFSDSRDSSGGVSLQVAMARLSRLTNVPVRVQADVLTNPSASGSGAAAPIKQATPVPMNGMPSPVLVNGGSSSLPMARKSSSTPEPAQPLNPAQELVSNAEAPSLDSVEMRYRGTLASYLNMVTDRLGLAWEFRDNTIVVMRFVNEMHEAFAFDGGSDYSFSTSGTGSGSGGGGGATNAATASLSVSEKGKSDPIASIQATIEAMVKDSPGSSVTRTEGSGRFMVKTTREMQSRVRDYIKSENMSMRRQAQIQFDIYSVTTDESDEKGVDWTGILNNAAKSIGGNISAPPSLTTANSAGASINVLPNIFNSKLSALFGNSNVILNTLSAQGYSAQHRPVSLLALNRQWARLSKLGTKGYLSETTPGVATTTGAGAPGLKTASITTGDSYVAMPQIMDDNTVLLKFGLSLSDLLGLFDVTSGSGDTLQKVQTPEVSAVNAQFPIAIKQGEVVAVTGLSRLVAGSDRRALGEDVPIGLGGSRKLTRKREHFIVFIRPTVM